MPVDALNARRLGAITFGVLALHVLWLDRAIDVARSTAAPSPHVRTAAVQLRAPAAGVAALAEPLASAIPVVPAPRLPPPHAPTHEHGATTLKVTATATATPLVAPMVPAQLERSLPRAPGDASMARADTAPAPPAPADASSLVRADMLAEAPTPSLPVYPTRPAPPFAFGYDLRRGAVVGTGELRWQPHENRYEASLSFGGGGAPAQQWLSVGGFDAAGLAPTRYTDRRQGRGALAANFQREAGKVTYSGPSVEHALPQGAQDRLSWMVQLAAIAAAEPSLVGPGGRVSFLVVGARGDAEVWTFVHVGEEALGLPDGSTATIRLLREPPRTYDTRAEVWLAPARHYLPVQARLSNAAERDSLQLLLREALPTP